MEWHMLLQIEDFDPHGKIGLSPENICLVGFLRVLPKREENAETFPKSITHLAANSSPSS